MDTDGTADEVSAVFVHISVAPPAVPPVAVKGMNTRREANHIK
jgi:hypothetical protein